MKLINFKKFLTCIYENFNLTSFYIYCFYSTFDCLMIVLWYLSCTVNNNQINQMNWTLIHPNLTLVTHSNSMKFGDFSEYLSGVYALFFKIQIVFWSGSTCSRPNVVFCVCLLLEYGILPPEGWRKSYIHFFNSKFIYEKFELFVKIINFNDRLEIWWCDQTSHASIVINYFGKFWRTLSSTTLMQSFIVWAKLVQDLWRGGAYSPPEYLIKK